MIITHNEEKEAVLVGDIQTNKVGIDRNNIDFITTLLSTNLYSEPIQSFLRETTANGWDSQVEAGNTDTPLIIRVYKSDDNINISIRDFGTGLSPERFDTIYRNIGSSTKRDTNDYIGCMGIGRFAALSCSNIVRISSYYNNTHYGYLMYQDGTSICIDKVYEGTGDYQNGVEIDVTVCKEDAYGDLKCIIEGLNSLSYFEGVYLECQKDIFEVKHRYSTRRLLIDAEKYVNDFNNRKIHDFGPFKVCTNCTNNSLDQCNVLMGNVLYPVKGELVNKYLHGLNIPIALKCDIGELDVTPNREELQYNSKTIKAIESKLNEARNVIIKTIEDYLSKDFNNVYDWYMAHNHEYVKVPLYTFNEFNEISMICTKSILTQFGIKLASTIKGVPIPKNLYTIYRAVRQCHIPTTYRLDNGKFYVEKGNILSISRYIDKYASNKVYVLDAPYRPITKRYFIENVDTLPNTTTYFLNNTYIKQYFYRTIRNLVLYHNATRNIKEVTDYPKEELRMIWEDFKRNYFNLPTFNNSDVPKAYIEAHKTKVSTVKKEARKCVIYTACESDKYDYSQKVPKVVFDTTAMSFENIPKYKGKIIYAEKDNKILPVLFTIYRQLSIGTIPYRFVEVAPTNMQALASFKNCTSLELFLANQDPILTKVVTSLYLKNHLGIEYMYTHPSIGIPNIDNTITLVDRYFDISYNVRHFPEESDRYKLFTEIYNLYIKKHWLDYNLLGKIEAIPNFVSLYNFIVNCEKDPNTIKKLAISYFIYMNKICTANANNLKKIKSCLNTVNQK